MTLESMKISDSTIRDALSEVGAYIFLAFSSLAFLRFIFQKLIILINILILFFTILKFIKV